jgi:hypothetical protein
MSWENDGDWQARYWEEAVALHMLPDIHLETQRESAKNLNENIQ